MRSDTARLDNDGQGPTDVTVFTTLYMFAMRVLGDLIVLWCCCTADPDADSSEQGGIGSAACDRGRAQLS